MKRRLAVALFLLFVVAASVGQARLSRVRVSEGVMEGLVVKKVPPAYPADAKNAKIQGTVVLQIIVNKAGEVENVQLVSGHPMLAPSAIDAVKQWKYKPYLLNGEAVTVETRVQVHYTLADDSAAVPGLAPSVDDSNAVPAPALTVPPRRIRVSEKVESGLLVEKVQPVYPQNARDQHVQGEVLMKMIVAKDGSVANLELISGHPMLVSSAMDAVRQWKYKPYVLNGAPVEVETEVKINYRLMD